MTTCCTVLVVLLLVGVQFLAPQLNRLVGGQNADEDYLRPDITAAEILRLRHFGADEYTVTTPDGYILTITRGYNPLLASTDSAERRLPVLFIHGIHNSGGIFVANTLNARPRDLSGLDISSMSSDELFGELRDEPSAGSLPLLLINCGHQVFFLNRRGNYESLGKQQVASTRQSPSPSPSLDAERITNATASVLQEVASSDRVMPPRMTASDGANSSSWLDRVAPVSAWPYINLLPGLLSFGKFADYVRKSYDTDFWNYTLDEQAQYDIPTTVDSILNRTGATRVSIVGHSIGGALTLMSLSSVGSLAGKVSKAVLWSPTFSLGQWGQATPLPAASDSNQIGPNPSLFKGIPRDAMRQVACNSRHAQLVTCQSEFDQMYGWGGGEQPVTLSYFAAVNRSVSSGEVAQREQFTKLVYPTKFDHQDPNRNRAAYGQAEPPVYNLTQINGSTLEFVSLYVGCTDEVVPKENVTFTSSRLSALAHKLTIINGTNMAFNHVGYYLHNDRAKQVIIPSLKDLAS